MSLFEGMGGLLRLTQLSGGEIDTRIRIQKEAFLIALAGDSVFNAREFVYHHYGPYSRGLSDVLQAAVQAGFLAEDLEGGQDESFTRYRYRITPAGEKFLSKCPPPSPAFERVVDICKNQPWRALELAATIRFLEAREGMERKAATEEALHLKPATRDFLAEANKVLAAI